MTFSSITNALLLVFVYLLTLRSSYLNGFSESLCGVAACFLLVFRGYNLFYRGIPTTKRVALKIQETVPPQNGPALVYPIVFSLYPMIQVVPLASVILFLCLSSIIGQVILDATSFTDEQIPDKMIGPDTFED